MPSTYAASPDRPTRSYRIVRDMLDELGEGSLGSKSLHRLRIHLRRLQALHELIGDVTAAHALSEAVSRFSKLRTLQVFVKYLKDQNAPKSDRQQIRRLIQKHRRRLLAKGVYRQTRQVVRQYALPPIPAHARWLTDRLNGQRAIVLSRLRGMALAASTHPRRRQLHALRLCIKSLRYQEECGFGHAGAQPQLVHALKDAQAALGAYEEQAQFRKLARRLTLLSASQVERDFRRARKLARALPHQLVATLQPFLPSQSGVHPATGSREAAAV